MSSKSDEISLLISSLSRLPGIGTRSARKVALHLLKNKESLLIPMVSVFNNAIENVVECDICGNIDTIIPCKICQDEKRDTSKICVVEDVEDLWALEKSGAIACKYHVLGGVLSAIDGISPEDLSIDMLIRRLLEEDSATEVIMALSATVEAQSTVYYIKDMIDESANNVSVSVLAHGIPVGGEIDYLDEGTLTAAITARKTLE